MQFAPGPDRAAKAGRNLVIPEIDVGAAPGTVGGGRCITDLMLPFALEARDQAVAAAPKDPLDLAAEAEGLTAAGRRSQRGSRGSRF